MQAAERRRLRAQAHSLRPVVLVGAAGLTDAVLAEIDGALTAHELIKIRLRLEEREQREAAAARIAERLGAAQVQRVGHVFTYYRPRPE